MAWGAYLGSVRNLHASGQATEHSYRPALAALLKSVGGSGVEAINEPSHVACGAPDFIVQRGGVPVGHVECKAVGADLAGIAESEQIIRYREALPNLILTDYLDFCWYVRGELRLQAGLAQIAKGKVVEATGGRDEVESLLAAFFAAETATVADSAELAKRMAAKARLLREGIGMILQQDQGNGTPLRALLDSYRTALIGDLNEDDFADMQAQTATYGLFAARWLHSGPPGGFTRERAAFANATPFLREVFGHVAGPSADSRIVWIVEEIASLLAAADMAAIVEGFGRRTLKQDPVVHFYEDFLAAYDPTLREMRGVYYTPEPVVSYIVRSIDKVLRDTFDLANGLADTSTIDTESADGQKQQSQRVLILDPAAGTGSFLREVVATVRHDLTARGLAGAWESYVRDHLLPRLFGFEIMMAPYAICHLKLALEIGGVPSQTAPIPEIGRLGVYLTNSLEAAPTRAGELPFAVEIANEARNAEDVKRHRPVMVIIGNPPYSGHSANKGKWINDLLRGRVADDPADYFSVDGKPLGESNSKWLNDDYVKFIRFAQWRINQTGEGILGFVTNHSYLDGPTFRGMRQSLMQTFDELYVLDLHGNANRKERAPDGAPDENVFDIRQGVAIGIFVKNRHGSDNARVLHKDIWGKRASPEGSKYDWLQSNDVSTTDWTTLSPESPSYYFVPRSASKDGYEHWWPVPGIFPVHSAGMTTARDKLAIRWTETDMLRVARDFRMLAEEDARDRYQLGKDSKDWSVASAQADLNRRQDLVADVRSVLYRPFDTRFTCYTGTTRGFMCRPRKDVMHHMLAGPNLGLSTTRGTEIAGEWQHVFASIGLITLHAVSLKETNYLFPLYLYPQDDTLYEHRTAAADRVPNLSPEFTEALEEATGSRGICAPEDVFHYIYAVLHSPEYRRRHADFLKSDFPRVPLPPGPELFNDLASLGERLVRLHTMQSEGDQRPTFTITGSNKIEKIEHVSAGRARINNKQHFDGVNQQTWEFTIGGYRPAERWLRDRKGRTLTFDDIDRYCLVCAAINETLRIMRGIDETIAAHGGWSF